MKPIDIYEKRQEKIYDLGLSLLKNKNDKSKIADAMKIFELIPYYKDADKKIEYCSKILSNKYYIYKNKIYIVLFFLLILLIFIIHYNKNNGLKKVKASSIYDNKNHWYYDKVSPSGFVYIYLQNGSPSSYMDGANKIGVDRNGVLQKDIFERVSWEIDKEKYFYYKLNGEMAKDTDIEMYDVRYNKTKHYYFDSIGFLLAGTFSIHGQYFDDDGDMVINKVFSVKYKFTSGPDSNYIDYDKPKYVTKYYYADKNGKVIYKDGWINVGVNTYYNKNGSLVHDETIEIDGKIYTFDKNCKLVN